MSQGSNPQGNSPQNQGLSQNQGFLQNQGYPQNQGFSRTPSVQSPLVWSILSMVCGCWPLGIVSIVYASKVNPLVAVGAFLDAKEAADKAKMWAWISFGVGFVVMAIYVILPSIVGATQEGVL